MYKIIFLGSPHFAIPTLESLAEDVRFEVVGVFTQPDRKVGRKQILKPSDIKKRALELGIEVYTPDNINTPENIEIIKNIKPDFLFSLAYGQIISDEILAIPKIEPINLHVSLLPKYRGASPIPTCLLNGDQETGVTYIRMIDRMDAGAMFAKVKTSIEKKDNAATLFDKIAEVGREKTPDILVKIAKGKLKGSKQNENEATYCKKISKADGEINWQTETAEEIFNKIRAYTPWPGCYTKFKGKILKIIEADCHKNPFEGAGGCIPQVEEDFYAPSVSTNTLQNSSRNDAIDEKLEKGIVIQTNNTIQITTKSGNLIPKIIQLEGKKPMRVEDFIKGKIDFVDAKLG